MIEKEKTDLALKRYDTVLRYFAHEQTVYWSRSQFYLVANAGMLAVISSSLKRPEEGSEIIVLLAGCLIGSALSWLWRRNLKAGRHWTDRWERILREELEGDAFGSIEVMRNNRPPPDKYIPTRRIAERTANLFISVWILAVIYVVWRNKASVLSWISGLS